MSTPVEMHLESVVATESLGRSIGRLLRGGDVVALQGPLGAGKTTLAKAIGSTLGVDDLSSPSFTIAHEYRLNSGLRFIHIDAWRLATEDDLRELGWTEWINASDVVLCVEWCDRIAGAIPSSALHIDLWHSSGGRDACVLWADQSRLDEIFNQSSGLDP
ncbi:MAG: tRNA (adenosine(37)-N6)-threonylcarbamoyltransferase complex ATPase subunit type 1 TsaE [Planctomycetes bacterium]|jgi:tRNA threonylcarbamoyladenosine biosynthesis protein TsaE|nr:tRNA (adenosine(37)-N6)-threonylcarbamoyltransferase complex ATPase subunit type 1 TsaE [Planctomycetota bacterium]